MSELIPTHPETSSAWSEARRAWRANRFWMETQNHVSKQYGGHRKQHWHAMRWLMRGVELSLRTVGLYERGVSHARDLRLNTIELGCPSLPRSFDGLRLLHISDTHFDGSPGVEDAILRLVADREFDVCVHTGDYRADVRGAHTQILKPFARLVDGVRTRYGHFGILGNHDDSHMVEPIERLGVRMLINEHFVLSRGGEHIQIIGTDDVHYYYTDQALNALQAAGNGFSIALVHSPELCDAAARAGVDVYLCGHTHAGQICLPGGFPVVKHVRAGHAYFRGNWRHLGMQGVTSSGAGASGVPVRFNSRPEVCEVVLRLP